jgi:hypothetical protein
VFGWFGINQPCPSQAFLDRAADQEKAKEPFVKHMHKLAARVREAAVTSGRRPAVRGRGRGRASASSSSSSRPNPAWPATGNVTSAMVRDMVPSTEWKVSEDLVNKRWLIRLPGRLSVSRSFQLYTGKGAALECLRAVWRYQSQMTGQTCDIAGFPAQP